MTATWQILVGDALEQLRTLPDASVHAVVTSPPYFGLRDYGVEGQIGLEATPDEYVAALVAVFSETRRVLRGDGTLWLNLGDSYNTRQRGTDNGWDKSRLTNPARVQKAQAAALRPRPSFAGSKPKDLLGMPWMVAFALRAEGWYLRQEIIWHKRSPMPESVTDRCTRAHEQVFMLARSPRYFYDAEAIAEPAVSDKPSGNSYKRSERLSIGGSGQPHPWNDVGGTRNRRSVWTLASEPFPEAHFATFPPALVEPCILASTSDRGACVDCGAPWSRVVEIQGATSATAKATRGPGPAGDAGQPNGTNGHSLSFAGAHRDLPPRDRRTTGFVPTCDCDTAVDPCVVLDPFAGAGTTLMVALRHGRSAIGIELSPEYSDLARRRIVDDAPLLNSVAEVAA